MQNQLLSLEMQALSDRMVDTLVSDLCIGREVDYPDIFVFDWQHVFVVAGPVIAKDIMQHVYRTNRRKKGES